MKTVEKAKTGRIWVEQLVDGLAGIEAIYHNGRETVPTPKNLSVWNAAETHSTMPSDLYKRN